MALTLRFGEREGVIHSEIESDMCKKNGNMPRLFCCLLKSPNRMKTIKLMQVCLWAFKMERGESKEHPAEVRKSVTFVVRRERVSRALFDRGHYMILIELTNVPKSKHLQYLMPCPRSQSSFRDTQYFKADQHVKRQLRSTQGLVSLVRGALGRSLVLQRTLHFQHSAGCSLNV